MHYVLSRCEVICISHAFFAFSLFFKKCSLSWNVNRLSSLEMTHFSSLSGPSFFFKKGLKYIFCGRCYFRYYFGLLKVTYLHRISKQTSNYSVSFGLYLLSCYFVLRFVLGSWKKCKIPLFMRSFYSCTPPLAVSPLFHGFLETFLSHSNLQKIGMTRYNLRQPDVHVWPTCIILLIILVTSGLDLMKYIVLNTWK